MYSIYYFLFVALYVVGAVLVGTLAHRHGDRNFFLWTTASLAFSPGGGALLLGLFHLSGTPPLLGPKEEFSVRLAWLDGWPKAVSYATGVLAYVAVPLGISDYLLSDEFQLIL